MPADAEGKSYSLDQFKAAAAAPAPAASQAVNIEDAAKASTDILVVARKNFSSSINFGFAGCVRQAQPRSRGRESRRDLLLVHLRQVKESAYVRRQPRRHELQAAGVDGPRDGAEVLLRVQADRGETVLRRDAHQDAGGRGGKGLPVGRLQVTADSAGGVSSFPFESPPSRAHGCVGTAQLARPHSRRADVRPPLPSRGGEALRFREPPGNKAVAADASPLLAGRAAAPRREAARAR